MVVVVFQDMFISSTFLYGKHTGKSSAQCQVAQLIDEEEIWSNLNGKAAE